jgi:hypothetical protein
MSAPFPFEQEQAVAPPPPPPTTPSRPRHPLGLPPGSVRALLTLMVLGTVWALLAMPAEKEIPVPLYLYYLTFLVIGSYFGTRSSAPRHAGEAPPLYLPRGSIRLIIIVGFAAVIGWGFYRNPNFLERLRLDDVSHQPYLPLVIFGAFFLGVIISALANMVLAGPRGLPPWYQDIQAWVSILAVLGLGAEVIYQLVIVPGLEPGKALELPHWQTVLSGIVAFYFGARSGG